MAGPLEPDWTRVLVGQVVDALDVVVIGEHQDGLLGVVVGAGKGDELLALVSDGVGGKDGVDLAVLQDDSRVSEVTWVISTLFSPRM